MSIHFPVAGKTGTIDDFKDAWFVGYAPDIVVLIWIGFDDGTSFQAPASALTLPIWADPMKSIPRYVSGSWFKASLNIVMETVCKESGQLARDSECQATMKEYFLAENLPKERRTLHRGMGPLEEAINGFKDLYKIF